MEKYRCRVESSQSAALWRLSGSCSREFASEQFSTPSVSRVYLYIILNLSLNFTTPQIHSFSQITGAFTGVYCTAIITTLISSAGMRVLFSLLFFWIINRHYSYRSPLLIMIHYYMVNISRYVNSKGAPVGFNTFLSTSLSLLWSCRSFPEYTNLWSFERCNKVH